MAKHLSGPEFFPFGANDAMIERIQRAIESGQPLSETQANFMRHELIESDLMARGMSYDQAHKQALTSHPPGKNYDLDIIDQFEEFGPWWRRMNGLGPR